jgi:TPR repeat protein
MYKNGQGVPQNSAEAVRWYRLAAGQGHAEAQHYLGSMHNAGRGVLRNYVEAYKWYALSAAQGDTKAGIDRDEVLERMTPAQIAEAQRLVAEWRPR